MIPETTRRVVMARSGGYCENCGDRLLLTLHHLHYDTVGAESPDDLRALCWPCHQAEHRDPNGDYWRDPVEMDNYWESYFNESEKA